MNIIYYNIIEWNRRPSLQDDQRIDLDTLDGLLFRNAGPQGKLFNICIV